jgi:GNAT superfamily N-acetyltransferase
MRRMWRIEPVPSRRRLEALRFLAGDALAGSWDLRRGGSDALPPAAHAQTLALFALAEGPPRAGLWWAWESRCAAVAMILEHPGHTGFLFLPAPWTPAVDALAMAEVVRAATREALQRGLYFVQVSLPADDRASTGAAEAWGYEFVAELIHMSLDLPLGNAGPRDGEMSLRDMGRPHEPGRFTEAELGELILATYEGSLDCPSLLRLRGAGDILASHKAGGEFRPQSWWIADLCRPPTLPAEGQAPRSCSGQAAGCILVNDRPMEEAAEVVYLGVRPEHRGQGLAGRLIGHAAQDAWRRGVRRLQLAVDARNAPARRAYERMGFRPTHRKWIAAAIRRES